jgi:hypothetical protein
LWIHALTMLEARGTHVAIVPAIFQYLFQYPLDISNAPKGQSINSNYFWTNCYNILKFRIKYLLLCIILDSLDTLFDLNSFVFLVW